MLLLLLTACFPRVDGSAGDPAADEETTDDSGDTTPDAESDCADGRDEDDDGDTDCDDTDCRGDADCDETAAPTHETDCGDGEDEDDDGDTDCDDDDCVGDDACEAEECWDEDVGEALGADIAGGAATGDDVSGSCGGGGVADSVLRWTAPSAGTFTFDTVGSAGDTVLWAVADGCEGAELDCNDDTFGDASQLSVTVSAGDVVLLGVESDEAWTLAAWEGTCPDFSLGSESGVTGSSEGFEGATTSECGDITGAVTLRWIAPTAGTWTFTTYGSDFDTILGIYDGGCEGAELACNDDYSATLGFYHSEASLALAAGDVVAIYLGGYEGETGDYSLSITSN